MNIKSQQPKIVILETDAELLADFNDAFSHLATTVRCAQRMAEVPKLTELNADDIVIVGMSFHDVPMDEYIKSLLSVTKNILFLVPSHEVNAESTLSKIGIQKVFEMPLESVKLLDAVESLVLRKHAGAQAG